MKKDAIQTQGDNQLSPEFQGYINMIRAAAADDKVDVAKLEKLLDMQERILNRAGEQRFNEAMTEAQGKMKRIAADARNPQTGSKYATYSQLDKALRPIYTEAGFALSFDTGQGVDPIPVPQDHIRIWLYLSHNGGFTRNYHVDMPNDGKGARGGEVMTRTHATGAGMSYGMRYLLKMAFNVAIGEDDKDGNERRSNGGQDHRYKDVKMPQSKSEQRAQRGAAGGADEADEEAPDHKLAAASGPENRVSDANLKTIKAQLRRFNVSEALFKQEIGFPIEDLDKHSLNSLLDWLKGRNYANA